MGIFDNLLEILKDTLTGKNKWVQRKAPSVLDLDVCNGEANNDTATNTCFLCISVNNCWFLNEENKIPLTPQHPKCRCKLLPIMSPLPFNINFIFDENKIKLYIYHNSHGDNSKKVLYESFGYYEEDADKLIHNIKEQAAIAYCKGNYITNVHNKNGQTIELKINLPGNREKSQKTFQVKTGWVIYPKGKLQFNTPLCGIKDKK